MLLNIRKLTLLQWIILFCWLILGTAIGSALFYLLVHKIYVFPFFLGNIVATIMMLRIKRSK